MAALERAAARWRGDPFPDLEASGDIASAIDEVRRLLTDTALRLGELLLVAGRFDDAAAWAERVKQASPYQERAHRLAIAAQLQRRDLEAVADAVAAARAMLDALGVEPEPGTRMLFRQAEDHDQALRLGGLTMDEHDAATRRPPRSDAAAGAATASSSGRACSTTSIGASRCR